MCRRDLAGERDGERAGERAGDQSHLGDDRTLAPGESR
jgi:hypothetical protein